jgi:pilus assembly protein CpaF
MTVLDPSVSADGGPGSDVVERVRTLVRERGTDPLTDPRAVRAAVLDVLDEVARGDVGYDDLDGWAQELHDAVAGFGPLQRLFDDPEVEEIWTCSGWLRA